MTKLLIFIASTVGGSVGWWLGAFVGTMTAFMVSIVGTAAAIYVARRWSAQYV